MTTEDRSRRAQRRREVAVLRKGRVQDGERDLHPVRGGDAISLLTRLTEESWSLAGLAKPSYRRSEIPCRFVPGARG